MIKNWSELFGSYPILNSNFARYWFHKYGKNRGVGADIGVSKLREFPVKKTTPEKQNDFVNVVDKNLAIAEDGDYLENPAKQAKVHQYEKQIDQLVYKLYDLTAEEIKIVEQSNAQ